MRVVKRRRAGRSFNGVSFSSLVNYLCVMVGGGPERPPVSLTIAFYSSKSMDAFAEIPFCFERQRPHSLLINGT